MSDLLKPFSNNQIDKLGKRLKAGNSSDEDLTMLSSFRNSFAQTAKVVADKVQELSSLPVAIRLKATLSIVPKLQRGGVKHFSEMQDIGGCRVTVANLSEQDALTEKLMSSFPDATLCDRVAKPSHGYRAKHVVVGRKGQRIEIQVRTFLQNEWALFSETMADAFGQNLKYGIGHSVVLRILNTLSDKFYEFDKHNLDLSSEANRAEIAQQMASFRHEIEKLKKARNDLLH